MEPFSCWQLANDSATLAGKQLQTSINLRDIGSGFSPLNYLGRCVERNRILSVIPSHELILVDSYCRENDLIASFSANSEEMAFPQIYWRYFSFKQAECIDLLISMKTNSLDSDASIKTCTATVDSKVFGQIDGQLRELQEGDQATDPIFIHRWESAEISYVELAHPLDVNFAALGSDESGRATVEFTLFKHRLEKGVIRRGLVRGAFVPAAYDFALAIELYEHLKVSPPPLTT